MLYFLLCVRLWIGEAILGRQFSNLVVYQSGREGKLGISLRMFLAETATSDLLLRLQ